MGLGNLLCLPIEIVRNVNAENQAEPSRDVETSLCVLNGNTFRDGRIQNFRGLGQRRPICFLRPSQIRDFRGALRTGNYAAVRCIIQSAGQGNLAVVSMPRIVQVGLAQSGSLERVSRGAWPQPNCATVCCTGSVAQTGRPQTPGLYGRISELFFHFSLCEEFPEQVSHLFGDSVC